MNFYQETCPIWNNSFFFSVFIFEDWVDIQSDSCKFTVWGSFPYLKGIFMSVTCSVCTLFCRCMFMFTFITQAVKPCKVSSFKISEDKIISESPKLGWWWQPWISAQNTGKISWEFIWILESKILESVWNVFRHETP